MPLQKIKLTPGINREGTNYSNEGGYYDCDKVRFRSGLPESIGGWVPYSVASYYGACYSMFAYTTVTGEKLVGLGTNLKCYVENGNSFYDITPITSTVNLISPNAFTTDTTTPTIIVVNSTAHGAVTNDFVIISLVGGAVNGVPASELNGERQITLLTANTFSFPITTTPTSSGTTGACTVEYELNVGMPYYVSGSGFGSGTWGRSTWGSGTSVADITLTMRLWGMSNYGDDLIYGPRGGALYIWEYAAGVGLGTRGSLISGKVGASSVPLTQSGILVSDQRFVVVFGSNDFGSVVATPMLVRWSNQEDYLEWAPAATNQAGSQILTNGSYIVTAKSSRQEILVWTDTALHSMQFQGPPYTYGFVLLGDNISIMGPNATVVVNGTAYWMGRDKFYVYDGRVQTLPSAVRTYIYGDMNPDAAWQTTAGSNEGFSEVWWLYAGKDSRYANKYVIYNYVENSWAYGTLDRTFWYDTALKDTPLATTYDATTQLGYLFYQEQGCSDGTVNPPVAYTSFVESSDFDIGDGHNFGLINRIIPDLTFAGSTNASPSVIMSLTPRRFSGSAYGSADENTVTRTASVPVELYTDQVYVRVRGRQMRFKINCTAEGTKWQMGAPRIDVRPDGRK